MGKHFTKEEQWSTINDLNNQIKEYGGTFRIESYFANECDHNKTWYSLRCTNPNCGRRWDAKKCDVVKIVTVNKGVGCYLCNRTAINNKRYANSDVKLYRDQIDDLFIFDNNTKKFECKNCGHKFTSTYSEITIKFKKLGNKNPCANCGGQRNARLDDIRASHIERLKQIEDLTFLNFVDYKERYLLYVECLCKKCNKPYKKRIQEIYAMNAMSGINGCPKCYNPYSGTSICELSISNFVASLNFKSKKYRLNNKEIDIFIEDKNIGFEVNGGFYHSDKFKTDLYHKNKTLFFEKNNIRIYHIFSFEWVHKRNIVETLIKNALGINKIKNIRSKDYVINNIEWKIAKEFLEKNHIMGAGNATQKCYGIFFENILQAVMTFTHPRHKTTIQKTENTYELHRYAAISRCYNAINNIINKFRNDFEVNKIITFADLRLSTHENIYSKSGFTWIEDTKPSYWWYKSDCDFYRRYSTQKHILIKKYGTSVVNKTEDEIMEEDGYLKVYDCGHAKYELILNR